MFGCEQRNLGGRASDQAVTRGVLLCGLALGIGFLATELDAAQTFGWLMALPLTASVYSMLSGTWGICAYNGIKGNRQRDYGSEPVLDEQSRELLRGQAWLAVSGSVLLASLLTAAFIASS